MEILWQARKNNVLYKKKSSKLTLNKRKMIGFLFYKKNAKKAIPAKVTLVKKKNDEPRFELN